MANGDLNLPNRRTIRLRNFDYSESSGYFITINTFQKKSVLGTVQNGGIALNGAGSCVEETWRSLEERFPFVDLDIQVVMPNHFHGVLFLRSRESGELRVTNEEGRASPARTHGKQTGLSVVVGAFKSISAIGCNRLLGTAGQPFWHRNYYEHVIRNEADLDRIRTYIANNAANWAEDEENPARWA